MIERPINIEQNGTNRLNPLHDTDNPTQSEKRLLKEDFKKFLNTIDSDKIIRIHQDIGWLFKNLLRVPPRIL